MTGNWETMRMSAGLLSAVAGVIVLVGLVMGWPAFVLVVLSVCGGLLAGLAFACTVGMIAEKDIEALKERLGKDEAPSTKDFVKDLFGEIRRDRVGDGRNQ